jgi:periplasmic protein TonB
MGYAEQQRSPAKHLTGITIVVVFHVLLAYAMVMGLARKVVDIVKPPIETKIIEEIKKPPPPETLPPPPPKMVQVLPTFVPPPEVQIQQPVIQQPTIQATTPVAPPVFAPPAPPAPPAPVAAPAPPAQVAVGVACPNSQQIRTEIKYPPAARKDGIEGEVLVEFTVGASGDVKDIEVKSSSNRVFNNVSVSAVRQFKCNAQGREVRVQVPFSFKLSD